MNETSNVVRGILHPDGTLELAERPTLPAGNVEVTIRPVVAEKTGENWFDYLQRTRAELEASGYPFLNEEEVDAYMKDVRDWGEDRLDEIRGQIESERPEMPTKPFELTNQPAKGEAPTTETLWQFMERTRAELEATGHRFRTKEEIDADMEDMRDWDGKVAELDRQREEELRRDDPR